MDKRLEQLVRQRARNRCEYCLLPEAPFPLKHPTDHVIARQHGGETVFENLALACGRCNLHKGPNIAGLDPATGDLTRLFNPRIDDWYAHFDWNGAILVGRTDIGRTTIRVLAINEIHRVVGREVLMAAGKFHV